MEYTVHNLKYGRSYTFTTHTSFGRAKAAFDGQVDYYSENYKPSITGVEIRDESGDTVLRWLKPEGDPESIAIKFGWKIHGIKTANGEARSANTQKFYETDWGAVAAAKRCLSRPNARGDDGIVIYKAVKLIRPSQPVVEFDEIDLETGDIVSE